MSKNKITFIQFLDYTYQNAAIELQKEFNLALDGKTKAVHWIMSVSRWWCKWWSVVKLIAGFFMCKLGFAVPPEPIPVQAKPGLKIADEKPLETPPNPA